MLPNSWREVTFDGDDEYETNDGVQYANSIFFHRGDKVIECKLDAYHLDELKLFELEKGHPAYDPLNPGRGVKAASLLKARTIIGFYAGVYRPGSFADENPYVFGIQPPELDLVIDALKFGNITRFINDPKGSGKSANLEAEDVIIQKGAQTIRGVQFRTLRDISTDEELFFDYEASQSGYWQRFGAPAESMNLISESDEVQIVKRETVAMEPTFKKHKATIVENKSVFRSEMTLFPHEIVSMPAEFGADVKFITLTKQDWMLKFDIPRELGLDFEYSDEDLLFNIHYYNDSTNQVDWQSIDLYDLMEVTEEDQRTPIAYCLGPLSKPHRPFDITREWCVLPNSDDEDDVTTYLIEIQYKEMSALSHPFVCADKKTMDNIMSSPRLRQKLATDANRMAEYLAEWAE